MYLFYISFIYVCKVGV